jgi:hypothetical protein
MPKSNTPASGNVKEEWYDTALSFLKEAHRKIFMGGEGLWKIPPEDCCEHRVSDGIERNGFYSAYDAILKEKQRHCKHDFNLEYSSSERYRDWDTYEMKERGYGKYKCSKCEFVEKRYDEVRLTGTVSYTLAK